MFLAGFSGRSLGLAGGAILIGLSLLARSSASPLASPVRTLASAGLFLGSLIFVVFLAWEWFLAVLVVGQPFLKIGLESLGGASRKDPASSSLLLLAMVAGAYLGLGIGRSWRARRFWPELRAFMSNRLLLAGTASVVILGLVQLLRLPDSLWPDYGLRKAVGFFLFSVTPFLLVIGTLVSAPRQRQFALALAVVGLLNAFLVAVFLWTLSGSPLGPGVLVKFTNQYFMGIPLEGGSWFARRTAVAGLSALALGAIAAGRLPLLGGTTGLVVAGLTGVVHGRAASVGLITGSAVFILLLLVSRSRKVTWGRRGLLAGSWLVLAAALITVSMLVTSGWPLSPAAPSADGGSVLSVFKYSPALDAGTFDPQTWLGTQEKYRLTWFRSAAEQFRARPLDGHGTGSWLVLHTQAHGEPLQPGTEYPHNIILEAAAELGLLGLAPMLTLLAVSAAAAWRAWSSAGEWRPLVAWALAVTLMGWLNAMLSGDLYRNDFVWVGSALVLALDHAFRREGLERRTVW